MNDEAILELYFSRNEDAIRETDEAYGRRLRVLAKNILDSREDAEENVSDTYLKTWQNIPPTRPTHFFAYLAQVCRFCAMDRLDRNHAAKRSARVVSLTLEMESCIPDERREGEAEARELGRALNRFLAALPRESRVIFLRRYWYCDTIEEIAHRWGFSESKVKTQLHRTRNKLRAYLIEEGIPV